VNAAVASLVFAFLGMFTAQGLASGLELAMRPGVITVRSGGIGGWMVRLGTQTLLLGTLLLLVQRPLFASSLLVALHVALFLVNNAKYRTLKEPFILHDFEYFTDAMRHPRLYLPFMGVGVALLGLLALGSVILVGIVVEKPLYASLGVEGWMVLSLALLLVGAAAIGWGVRRLPGATLEPTEDLSLLGFWGMVWRYAALLRQPLWIPLAAQPFASGGSGGHVRSLKQKTPPPVLLVQSESFFDPRHCFDFLAPEVLAGYDRLRSAAWAAGRLEVPAWGANTVRTEAAVLTGIAPEKFGVRRFNPYAAMVRHHLPNLVAWLRNQGYRTVCVHPYPAGFYRRNRVFARMGFHTFLDINAFSGSARCGQYIGDEAVAALVEQLLLEPDPRPLFVFVITMENHGPLHLESPGSEDRSHFYREGVSPAGCDDLTVYLRHLANADKMLIRLAETLKNDGREGVLGWYGDHVPIMAEVYQRYGYPPGFTNYLIWSTALQGGQQEQSLDAASMGTLLAEAIARVAEGKTTAI